MKLKQMMLRAVAVWITAAVLFCLPVRSAPAISAQSAVLIDGATGRELYAHRAHERSLIASTTKIMTGLLIAESCPMDAEVSVPPEAVGTEGSSLYLKEGECLTVEALLYGLMLQSGNDAAVTLAMYSAGSVDAFAGKMNRKAAELGLQNTHFVNPHGLDAAEHYSTASDLAKLTAYAMENPVFRKVVSTRTISFGERTFTNHNRLLWQYDGAVGVKTGYTQAAGRILVSCAQRDGRRLIAVTIADRNDWADHRALLDHGFSAFTQQELVRSGQILGHVPVLGGGEQEVQAVIREGVSYPVSAEETVVLRAELPPFVFAPVLAGEEAGHLHILIDGAEQAVLPLYWRYSVLEGA